MDGEGVNMKTFAQEYSRKYYLEHREKLLPQMREYNHEYSAQVQERQRYLLSHPEELDKIRQRIMDENR